jgi:hypothetical protein
LRLSYNAMRGLPARKSTRRRRPFSLAGIPPL